MKRYQSSSFTYVILTEVTKVFSDNMRIDRSQTRMIIFSKRIEYKNKFKKILYEFHIKRLFMREYRYLHFQRIVRGNESSSNHFTSRRDDLDSSVNQ